MYSQIFRLKSKDNLIASTANLLNLLKVKVTHNTIKDTLLSNPNYPSLLSVSESLKQWKIDAEAYTVAPDKLALLPVPFMAHLKADSGSFVAVREVNSINITYLKDNGSENKIALEDFYKKWSNNVLLVDASHESGQSDYIANKRKEQVSIFRFPLLVTILTIIAAISFIKQVDQSSVSQLLLRSGFWGFTILGAITTSLLLWYEYDNNNAYLKNICSINKKTNCSAVLNSKASKILGFSWSEIGFFYFIGSLIYLLLGGNSSAGLYPLIVLNIIALPYIVFSIIYQAFVVKQWCVLCLVVQFILFAEFLTSWLTGNLNNSFFTGWRFIQYNQLILAFFLPVALWTIIKPYLYRAKESEEIKYNFKRFKNSPEVFNSILQRQMSMKNNPEGLGITFGNPSAGNILIKVCNPYCGPCARSFPYLEELVSTNDNWRVQILFTASPDKNDYRSLPVAHFLEINDRENNDDKIIKALGDWYNEKDKHYDIYAKKYPLKFDFEDQQKELALMDDWCLKENISFTPTYYVNGRRLPENYSVEDLKNIF